MKINLILNAVRRRMGVPYGAFSAYLKNQMKDAVKSLADFEKVVTEEARRHGADGVVCGHLHRPAIEDITRIRISGCKEPGANHHRQAISKKS